MVKWLDENTIVGEISDAKFLEEVTDHMRKRITQESKEGHPGNYGNDGNIEVYAEKLSHEGIDYYLKALRYFAVERLPDGNIKLRDSAGMNDIGKWVVVESAIRPSYELKDFLDLHEFLWHDTVHSGQERWTLQRQWEHAQELAQEDAERVKSLEQAFVIKTAELKEELDKWLTELKGEDVVNARG